MTPKAQLMKMTEDEYQHACDQMQGLCRFCCYLAEGVEPDAEGYPCELCGQAEVIGLEQAFLLGFVVIH